MASCAEIIRRVADMIDNRLSGIIETILERLTGKFLEIVRTETEELRTVNAELRREQTRVNEHLARTARLARRLDRAGRAIGFYDEEDPSVPPPPPYPQAYPQAYYPPIQPPPPENFAQENPHNVFWM